MDDIFYGNFYRRKNPWVSNFILLFGAGENVSLVCEKSSLSIRFERRESEKKIPPKNETYLRQNQFCVLSNLESCFDVSSICCLFPPPEPSRTNCSANYPPFTSNESKN